MPNLLETNKYNKITLGGEVSEVDEETIKLEGKAHTILHIKMGSNLEK